MAAAALAAALLWAGPAPATKLLSDQQQLTASGGGTDARGTQAAYNSKRRQYLVVYAVSAAGDSEIFARRLDDLGIPIDGPIQVTNTPGAGSASEPVVAYDRKTNSYLVAYVADGVAFAGEVEVLAQRIEADGGTRGSPIQVSDIGEDADLDRGPVGPIAIAHNGDDDQFLVAWSGDDLADDEFEIEARRLGAPGNPIGAEIAVSTTLGAERDAHSPSVTYNPESRDYLVVWEDDGFGADEETEVFGQRVNSAGVPVGGDDFRISQTGPDGLAELSATLPSAAANTKSGDYLVAFSATLSTAGDREIKIQPLDPDGGAIVGDDIRISDAGPEGDPNRDAIAPRVAFSPSARQFLVAYAADDLGVDDEFEVYAQRVGADGSERGDNDVRVSQIGPEGNPDVGVGPAPPPPVGIAVNNQLSEWVVSYWGEGAADEIFDAYSRRVGLLGKCRGKPARVGGPGRDLIKLGKGRDVIAGRGGPDNIRGGKGKDKLCGGKGKDRLSGGRGKDKFSGGKGRDRCIGGKGRDKAKGCEARKSL